MSELDPPATKSGGPGVAGLFAQGAASIRTVRGRRHHLGHAPLACTTTLAMKHCAMQHHLCHAPPLMTCTTLRCTTTYAMHHCAMHHHSGRAQRSAREYYRTRYQHPYNATVPSLLPLHTRRRGVAARGGRAVRRAAVGRLIGCEASVESGPGMGGRHGSSEG